ncbi:hypothetical protein [Chenggangzhangella methanolivorans]|uniref:Uncharacterized protein n=1 Tax=Chenggangzhangella methanolivorans TaxID=1437009 RepID=A0A9E6RI02_9HYPH|nr:hypothetical protein [Chenggangzhangella methanolivorans]QZO01372.1 hypothetical protein K6K41_07885 [Chenggangzhangella methanolivorans]
MTFATVNYLAYIAISAALTIWVAHTLSTRGRVFLVEFLRGNETLADSINHLLVVGFYLVNLGYAMLAMSYGEKPETVDGVLEALSFKVGLVMLVLGATHFFNMSMIAQLGKKLDRFFQMQRGEGGAQAAPAK